ncbi:MAG TPA: hypothetical protein ENN18_11710 [Proteobacteria bacterium]|mgnify:CR=1 FL=1|nr:hypothetical protein [Pseudomonadota bacterium]
MRFKNRTISVVLPAIVLAASALAFMTADKFYVAAPGFACVLMVLWLWMTLWDRDQKIPFFDVGMFCALATLVYTVYPLVNYWVDGLQFGILSDNRLRSYNPEPYELGLFHLRHVLYLFSFVVFYSVFRGKGTIEVGNVSTPSRSTRQIIVLFFLILTGYFFLLGILTGDIYTLPETYGERIAIGLSVASNMPLLLLQISGKLAGILFVFKLALLFIVVSRCRQKKWFIILLVWVTAEIIQTFILKGGRSGLVLFLMATALFYHRMIKPLSMKFLITSGAALFIFFIFLGLYRAYAYIDFASLQTALSQANAGIFSGSNEFQTLLGTAYDVLQRKIAGADLPWYLYINDFIMILPPQQLVPFEKVTASEWYLREIGISGTGQGFMWGVISQSIVGLDWIELALRGALLGYILARIHRWYLKHQSGFLETLLYLFFCLKVYYTFRNTTFSLLANLVWEIIPFYILLLMARAIFSVKVGDQPGHRIAMTPHNVK